MPRSLFPLRFFVISTWLLAGLLSVSDVLAVNLSKSKIDSVSNATVEVVVRKRTNDPLTYERPLPMHLIPFAVRKDPYYSIGTAFAIGPNRWVTAAHVLDLGRRSLHKTYELRDRNGKIHEIGQILKYSYRRDFVVFSLKERHAIKPLAVNASPRLNTKVYAAGNALGEGIVFRDGLYTSATEEEEDGEWKWLRFSAAASPGNSGGPLLDTQGRVVGIIVRKSANENLNFALPISEVLKAPEGIAELQTRMLYKIDNMPNMSSSDRLRKEIALPKSYAELDAVLTAEFDQFGVKLKDDLLAQHRDRIFPNGRESLPLLHSYYNATMPGLIGQAEDDKWDVFFPKSPTRNDIGTNGNVTYGKLGSSQLMLVQKPDEVQIDTLYKDSKVMMEWILKGNTLYRKVGPENIRVTSLNKAVEEYTHTDRYDRKWLVRVWNVGFNDSQVGVVALPVPGGLIAMARVVGASEMASHMVDLKLLADFAYFSYYGTFEQWREFLVQRDLLPQAFADIKIDFEYGKHFRYTSKRLAFSYDANDMRITERSDLKLQFSHFRQNGKAVWDVVKIVVGESKDNSTFFSVMRNVQPAQQLDDNHKSAWDTVVSRRHPYNGSAYFNDKSTMIADVLQPDVPANQLVKMPLLYTASYGMEGTLDQKLINGKLRRLMEQVDVMEY